ncbi:phosphopentomutase [Mycoplasmopsis fermentans]|uniref:Phosphopentomutase n=2 Tax=Mycoplasmopsis fermentans TaxID=2115 RepID=C4XDV0_MYCFP|nr:phosphopentomutase [Mycoplasmopsis fermentans]VEU67112.1 Phosphopentomutase [Mesomycoplasma conjunctivae]ADV34630.1 Phosphopentomutase [Mycoplasmopsis fermentans M64]RMX35316.1 phosphopentomutase [Mycoplasmopsis fermentans MF-I2]RMX35456.1 phosphopentomutase [Mycoplasmopsis fermentans MF-I1]VEU63897.1 Phosphopentomutase [Mycoplasmopsis fermentans]
MAKFKRVFMIVTDGLGIGPDKDQRAFGDKGANTILSASKSSMFFIDTWKKLGIGNITTLEGNYRYKDQKAYMTRIQEVSNAKDTLAGHWEMMGIKTMVPFPTFTENGFPQDLLDELSKAFDGRKIICNKSGSGTEMIDEYAEQQKKDGSIIVYTSMDSVLQIAAHEEWIGLDNLYRYGKAARQICSSKPEWNVGRIIVRPFIGEKGKYTRTFNRHDYANQPRPMILNELQKAGVNVIGIGKIFDIFVGQGISESLHSDGDAHGMDLTIKCAEERPENTFVFTNLVQFDSHYGHRRDVDGYASNIALLDSKLGKLINAMKEDDLLIITSDHGNDPLYPGFNHTRELLPLTIFSKRFKKPKVLEDVLGLGTSGNIVARNWGVKTIEETGDDIFDQLV